VALSALGLALVVWLSVSVLGQAGERMYAQQLVTLENALRRATVTCYALEGRYPDTLDYLTENYGVVIDIDRFIVSYSVFGRNVMPSIGVFPMGSDGGIPMNEMEIDMEIEIGPFEDDGGIEDAF